MIRRKPKESGSKGLQREDAIQRPRETFDEFCGRAAPFGSLLLTNQPPEISPMNPGHLPTRLLLPHRQRARPTTKNRYSTIISQCDFK